jgi:hypothetical protein
MRQVTLYAKRRWLGPEAAETVVELYYERALLMVG